MIFIHKNYKEIFGYHDKTYSYFCKKKSVLDRTSWEYNWSNHIKDGTLRQLAPTNLWRW